MSIIDEKKIREIYNNYITLDFKQVDSYIEQITKELGIHFNTLKKYIMEELTEQEKKLWDSQWQKVKVYRNNYVKDIFYLLEHLNENIDYRNFGKKSRILENIDKFLEFYPEKKDDIKLLKEQIEYYYNKNDKSQFNLKKAPNYLEEIKNILDSETDEIAISKIMKYRYSLKKWKYMMSMFSKYCVDSEDYILKLQFWFNEYVKRTNLSKNEEMNNLYRQNLLFLSNIVESKMSIEEYCDSSLNYNVHDIKKIIEKISYQYDISSIRNYFNTRKNYDLKLKVIDIAKEIKNNPNFTIIDYFIKTKLSIYDFIKILEEADPTLVTSTKTFFNCTGNLNDYFHLKTNINEDKLLSIKYIIGGREITFDEKKNIIEYLKNNQVPLNYKTFKIALDQYLNEKVKKK